MRADQKKMNSYQAKRIPLAAILARLGHEPHHEKRGELYYFSPFREESEPSFSIKLTENIWYDFGAGVGGGVIDFLLYYYQLGNNVAEALRYLHDLGPFSTASVSHPVHGNHSAHGPRRAAPQPESSQEDDISFTKVNPLTNTLLLAYLKNTRGLDTNLARHYVQEMYFRRKGKDRWYFALAFPNDSGGYELRNADDVRVFKRVYGHKDITTLLPDQDKPVTAVLVFEGFTDFLSALTHYRIQRPTLPVIILNGIGQKEKAVEKLRELQAQTVYLYLDQDVGGRDTTRYLIDQLPEVDVQDKSALYKGYNDFNAYLQAQRHLEPVR